MATTKPAMTPRQRVLAALNHQEPDRVPLDIGSSRCTSIHLAGYQRLKHHFGIEAPDIITDRMQQCVQLDDRILEQLGVDTRGIVPGGAENRFDVELGETTYRDEWGVVRSKPDGSYWYDLKQSPLAGEITVQDIAGYPWPDPDDPGRTRGLRRRALEIKAKGDYALVLSLTLGVVHISQYLRGFQDWFMDLAADQRLIGTLMDGVLETTSAMARNLMLEVGDLADIVLTGEDLGTQSGPQMSPAAYRQIIKPRHASFYRLVQEMCPQAKIALHSCGSVYALLPDLMEIGVQVLNPVQTTARDMDPARLKAQFGDRLSFWGGVDTQYVLPRGSQQEVQAEVRRRIGQLGPGGGYILSAVHNVQPDVPTENLVAMFDCAREAGAYPLPLT